MEVMSRKLTRRFVEVLRGLMPGSPMDREGSQKGYDSQLMSSSIVGASNHTLDRLKSVVIEGWEKVVSRVGASFLIGISM